MSKRDTIYIVLINSITTISLCIEPEGLHTTILIAYDLPTDFRVEIVVYWEHRTCATVNRSR